MAAEAEPKNIACLISNKGQGSNLKAVIEAAEAGTIDHKVALVVSDKPDAAGLSIAEMAGIPSTVRMLSDRKDPAQRDLYSLEIARLLNLNFIDITIFAGWMTILTQPFFDEYGKICLNIHPGLIPDRKDVTFKFPDGSPAPWNQGLMTEKAVANFRGLKYAGSTIHIVTPTPDFGPVLERVVIEKDVEEEVDTIYPRLKVAEHQGLVKSLQRLGRIAA